jgi:hypothetical protein
MPLKTKTPLAGEYAKCKNRSDDFTIVMWSRPPYFKQEAAAEEFAMTDDPSPPPVPERKPLTPAAQRALAEAEARRKAAEAAATPHQKEFQGPKGPEPTRYGDWERKGIASDF